MRRWVLIVVALLVAAPAGWWGYKLVQPRPAARIERTVAKSAIEAKRVFMSAKPSTAFDLAPVVDLVSIGSGLTGMAAFFREHKTKKRRSK